MTEDATAPQLDPQATYCVGLVEAAAHSLRAAARDKGVALQFDAPDDSLVLRTDRLALSRNVLEMIRRAIEANDCGSIWISVSRVMRDGTRLVEVRVASSAYTNALLLPDR